MFNRYLYVPAWLKVQLPPRPPLRAALVVLILSWVFLAAARLGPTPISEVLAYTSALGLLYGLSAAAMTWRLRRERLSPTRAWVLGIAIWVAAALLIAVTGIAQIEGGDQIFVGLVIGALWGGLLTMLFVWIRGRESALATYGIIGGIAASFSELGLVWEDRALNADDLFQMLAAAVCGSYLVAGYWIVVRESLLYRIQIQRAEAVKNAVGPFDLENAENSVGCGARRFWRVVFLFSLRDHASELLLEPDEIGYKLRYRVKGVWYDMVPPPAIVIGLIRQEIRVLAGFGKSKSVLTFLHAGLTRRFRLNAPFAAHGRIPLRLDVSLVEAALELKASRLGERITLRFPEHGIASERTQVVLEKVLHEPLVSPAVETGLCHVRQGNGNCAVAAAATVAGVGYEEAAACLPDPARGRPPSRAALTKLLERLTHRRWQHSFLGGHSLPIGRIQFPNWPVIAFTWDPSIWTFRSTFHCIVVKGGAVHDPNLPHAVPLDQYSRRKSRVLDVYEPSAE